jgi:putative transposase
MREPHLWVKPNLQRKAKRTPTRGKPRPTKPHEWWGIDRTKGLVEGVGWIYIGLVLDWYTKTMVGYYAGMQCTAPHWRAAWDIAVHRQFLEGGPRPGTLADEREWLAAPLGRVHAGV